MIRRKVKEKCKKKSIFNDFENIVENGIFAHSEQMLIFPPCFQN